VVGIHPLQQVAQRVVAGVAVVDDAGVRGAAGGAGLAGGLQASLGLVGVAGLDRVDVGDLGELASGVVDDLADVGGACV
jgi:hypothetical protein